MNEITLRSISEEHPELLDALNNASFAYYKTKQRDGGIWEGAFIGVFSPIIFKLIIDLGLPWLTAARAWSELQVAKAMSRISKDYENLGVPPEKLTDAAQAFRESLNKIEDPSLRKRLEEFVKSTKG